MCSFDINKARESSGVKFIPIEDLVANALIELVEQKGYRQVAYSQLTAYGNSILKILYDEKNTEAVVLMSRDDVRAMIFHYVDFFKIEEIQGEEFVCLNDEKSAEDLRSHFRAYLSLDMCYAFTSARAIDALGVVGTKC